MKLIVETVLDSVQTVSEAREDGSKDYFIEGIFMQSEAQNKNGRIYPKSVLMKEADRYQNEFVSTNRALGELGHPDGPTVNLERVSHIIKNLRTEGNNIVGRAKIMNTPYGNIVKNLIDEGAKIGVSSRGMGSLKKNNSGINEVQSDFMLAAVDIVADPSAPEAFVNGVMEGKEWVWNNGCFTEKNLDCAVCEIEQAAAEKNKQIRELNYIKAFNKLLSSL
tara:strand:- start:1608 stop:2270 length:663 start_codon:yes stop_codon:yes gene_type:complete